MKQNDFIEHIELITDSITYDIIKYEKKSLLFCIYNRVKHNDFYNLIELFINSLSDNYFLFIRNFVYVNHSINSDRMDILLDILKDNFRDYLEE